MANSIRERVRLRRGHDARSVANILIRKGIDSETPITPLQIMKVLYFCHGWTLARLNRPLVRQPFEVWRFGPVVRDVYHALKHHGRDPVTHLIAGVSDTNDFGDDERKIVDMVFQDYGYVNGLVLSYLTHVPGGPWDQVRLRHGEGVPIPNRMIRDYFIRLVTSPAD